MKHSSGDRLRYLRSLSAELEAKSTRVRDLIGTRHWLSDGRHKEQILAAAMANQLPAGVIATSGFVLDSASDGECSKEQDLLLVDTLASHLLFNEPYLAVAFPSSIRAAISVKSSWGTDELKDACAGLATAQAICRRCGNQGFVSAAFFFGEPKTTVGTVLDNVEALIESSARPAVPVFPTLNAVPFGPSILSGPSDVLIRLDYATSDDPQAGRCTMHAYSCQGLAASFFLAYLFDHAAKSRGATDAHLNEFLDDAPVRLIDSRTFDVPP